jgi:hypothetical protein
MNGNHHHMNIVVQALEKYTDKDVVKLVITAQQIMMV